MREVHPGLCVGYGKEIEDLYQDFNGSTYEFYNQGVDFLAAAKEPYHRDILKYNSKAAPAMHPEYLFALRDIGTAKYLALNLVDAEDPAYIPKVVIDKALSFITERINLGRRVFLFCKEGKSRSPGIAFIWMYENEFLPGNFKEAGQQFLKLYPDFMPKNGMFQVIKSRVAARAERNKINA